MIKFTLILTLLFLLTGCALGQQPCSVQSEEFVVKMEELAVKWDDANQIALNSSRISLGPAVATLQGIRREANGLTSPECAQNVKDLFIAYMDVTIKTYLDFMAQKTEAEVAEQSQLIPPALELFATEKQKLRDGEEPYN